MLDNTAPRAGRRRRARRGTRWAHVALAAMGLLVGTTLTGTSASFTDSSPATVGVVATTWDWSVYKYATGVGDWDNDGANDVMSYSSDGTLRLHRGNGNGTFRAPVKVATVPTTLGSLVGLGKLPGSSQVTLWWWQTTPGPSGRTNPAFVATSDGSTGMSAPKETTAWGWQVTDNVSLGAKIDTSGTPVLLARWSGAYTCPANDLFVYALSAAGDANITSYGDCGWNYAFPGGPWRVVGIGDWTGDGKGDIAGFYANGDTCVYAGNGTQNIKGLTVSCSPAGVGWGWNVVDMVLGGWDYNGDGRPDLLGRWIASGKLFFYPNPVGGGPPATLSPVA